MKKIACEPTDTRTKFSKNFYASGMPRSVRTTRSMPVVYIPAISFVARRTSSLIQCFRNVLFLHMSRRLWLVRHTEYQKQRETYSSQSAKWRYFLESPKRRRNISTMCLYQLSPIPGPQKTEGSLHIARNTARKIATRFSPPSPPLVRDAFGRPMFLQRCRDRTVQVQHIDSVDS